MVRLRCLRQAANIYIWDAMVVLRPSLPAVPRTAQYRIERYRLGQRHRRRNTTLSGKGSREAKYGPLDRPAGPTHVIKQQLRKPPYSNGEWKRAGALQCERACVHFFNFRRPMTPFAYLGVALNERKLNVYVRARMNVLRPRPLKITLAAKPFKIVLAAMPLKITLAAKPLKIALSSMLCLNLQLS